MLLRPNIIPVIRSRMRWAGHVTRREEKRGAHRVLMGKSWERDRLEDTGVNGRIMSKRNK